MVGTDSRGSVFDPIPIAPAMDVPTRQTGVMGLMRMEYTNAEGLLGPGSLGLEYVLQTTSSLLLRQKNGDCRNYRLSPQSTLQLLQDHDHD